MSGGERVMLDAVLAALYLRGLTARMPAPRSGWPRVLACLRRHAPGLGEASSVLHEAGLRHEGSLLETPGLLEQAVQLAEQEQLLSAVDPLYPQLWLERLGAAAPPVLWRDGPMPACPLVGVVGSRECPFAALDFARRVGRQALCLGYGVVSGGAVGCDRAAVSGSLEAGGDGRIVELHPRGLLAAQAVAGITRLSLAPPSAPFSAAQAIERNTLIYAASSGTVVADARWRQGGTWSGVQESLRRRLCPLAVRADSSPALTALVALGCHRLSSEADLAGWLDSAVSDPQGRLFVREEPAFAYGAA